MSLKDIAKSIASKKQEQTIDKSFLNDLKDFIIFDGNWSGKPNPTVKPSMIGGCLRRVYFCVTQTEVDNDSQVSSEVVGMSNSGTDRHERLQNAIIKMTSKENSEWEWINVADYVKNRNVEEEIGTKVVKQMGNETKLYNEQYNLSFLCDGVIKNKETGQYYILEIKTETSFKYQKHQSIFGKHKQQAKSYFLGLGIPKVIFIYENRDVCTKKSYLIEFDKNDKQDIIDRILYIDNYVNANEVPPMTKYINKVEINKSKDCKYCNYKTECSKWGE